MAEILLTKVLLPKRPKGLLHRSRLVDFIHAHVDRPLILISAAAGYGKTTLLLDFAYDTELPVCWYSLDPADAALDVFFSHLVASIRQRYPEFGHRSLEALQSVARLDEASLYPLVAAFVNELVEVVPEYFVIILDDYHLVDESPAVNSFLAAFLNHIPEHAHLIVASRSIPSRLPLVRLSARQRMAGLGTHDLRFTPDEIQALIRQNYQIELSLEAAEELAQRADGWITGILLSAQATGRAILRYLQGPGDAPVYEYLATEVFMRQSGALQSFLLESSTFEEFTPSACEQVLGRADVAQMLETIEEHNLFITRIEGEESWYRYHHLFRAFLQDRLQRTAPDRYRELHFRAAMWNAEQGRRDRAIDHYLLAEAYEEAVQALEQDGPGHMIQGQWSLMLRWITALPPEVMRRYPQLSFYQAVAYMEQGAFGRAADELDRALEDFRALGDRTGEARVLAEQANLARLQGCYAEAVRLSRQALELLPSEEDPALAGRIHRALGLSLQRQGAFEEGIEHLRKALELYQQVGRRYNVAMLHQELGTSYEGLGDTAHALEHFREALALWDQIGNVEAKALTLNSLGVQYLCLGRYNEAREILEEALGLARQTGNRRTEAYVLVSLGDLYRQAEGAAEGTVEQALPLYQNGLSLAKELGEGFLQLYTYAAMAETLARLGNVQQAQQAVDQALALANAHDSPYELGVALLARSAIALARKDPFEAQRYLYRAQELLRPSNARRDLVRVACRLAVAAYQRRDPDAVFHYLGEALTQLSPDDLLPLLRYELHPVDELLEFLQARMPAHPVIVSLREILRPLPALSVSAGVEEVEEAEGEVATLRLFGFGPTEIWREQRLLGSKEGCTPKTRELLFFLLEHVQGQTKDVIVENLWPDLPPSRATSTFHATLYRLRRALGAESVRFVEGRYVFDRRYVAWYDVEEFEYLLTLAHRSGRDLAQGIRLYRRAIKLYRGDFLTDLAGTWMIPRREELHQQYLQALANLAQLHFENGDFAQVVSIARYYLQEDPYQEAVYRLLMRAYLALGNRAAAIESYNQCVRRLQEDLGIRPEPETTNLYRQIRS